MTRRLRLLALLWVMGWSVPGYAAPPTVYLAWHYPPGVTINPDNVRIIATLPIVTQTIDATGGTIVIRPERDCYRLRLWAPPYIWDFDDLSGCQPLTGQWQPTGYAVTWAAPEPACLVINQQLLGDVPCATTGQVVLARAGGDWHTAAIPGRTLTLVAAAVITQPLASVVIPEETRRVALPVVAGR